MRKIYFSLMIAIAAIFMHGIVQAQSACPTLGGGTANIDLRYDPNETYYPGATVPAGGTGWEQATTGTFYTTATTNRVYPLRVYTINPKMPDNRVGKVVLRFAILEIGASSAEFKVYAGTSTSGTLLATINQANVNSMRGTELEHSGPVTVSFQSPTSVAGNFEIEIGFYTGDQVVTTALGTKVAYWTDFITPNSYTAFDKVIGHSNPIVIAYFDANKNYVATKSDVMYCIDYGLSAPYVPQNEYPGQLLFTPTLRADFDRNGTVQRMDTIKAARVLHILNNIRSNPPAAPSDVQSDIDNTTRTADYETNYGSTLPYHTAARAAIPASTVFPTEPSFSVTGPAATTAAGVAQQFQVNFTNDGGNANKVFKLNLPAGVTINSVTGATYNAANKTITFAAAPAVATVTVTSAIAQMVSLNVAYEHAGFWNLKDMKVFIACTGLGTYQAFVGPSMGENLFPNRKVELVWTPSPVSISLVDFSVANKNAVALLQWNTASEKNNRGFDIERSADGKSWNAIGFVSTQADNGNSSVKVSYNYTDIKPLSGKNYYRLKQQDFDGQFEYSKIEMITFNVNGNISVYPNPVSDELSIEGVEQNAVISIYNTLGQEIKTIAVGAETNKIRINVATLSKGTYYIAVRNAENKVMGRLQFVKY